jgi:hypothetical protein
MFDVFFAASRPAKRARFALEAPPSNRIVSVRQWLSHGMPIRAVVPDEWTEFTARLQRLCGLTDTDRIYYFLGAVDIHQRKKLASETEFQQYLSILADAGSLPDLWIYKPPSQGAASPEAAPALEVAPDNVDKKSVGSRSSGMQSDFRDALQA